MHRVNIFELWFTYFLFFVTILTVYVLCSSIYVLCEEADRSHRTDTYEKFFGSHTK